MPPVEFKTLVLVNVRKVQPKTKKALLDFFSNSEPTCVLDCDREEMDQIMVIPLVPQTIKDLKKALRPKPVPQDAEKKEKQTSATQEIAKLVNEG